MIVMPACSSGWFWHCLARETGRIGHLYSPGAQRGPWPWFPYAIDNGVFAMWNPSDNSFCDEQWETLGVQQWRQLLFWCQAAPIKPRWGIVPDRPGSWSMTLEKWRLYATEMAATGIPLAVAVQDGAIPSDVFKLNPVPAVIAVGGSTEWKWETAPLWLKEFPRVHVLRCNSPEKLYWLESLGCESCDGTGWNRGDRKQTEGLEKWARSKGKQTAISLAAYVCRQTRKNEKQQLSFA